MALSPPLFGRPTQVQAGDERQTAGNIKLPAEGQGFDAPPGVAASEPRKLAVGGR